MGKNFNADIDNTLFGSAKAHRQRAVKSSDGSHGLNKGSAVSGFYSGGGSAGASQSRSRRTMQLVSKNEVRNITLRSSRGGPNMVVIPLSRYQRIRANAIPLAENAEAQLQLLQTKKLNELRLETEARREEYKEIDRARGAENALGEFNDLEIERKEREDLVLKKAKQLAEDNEDDVKALKSTILLAQCQAVRDAQVREKEELEQALKEEESRLDAMMEAARQRGVEEAARKEVDLKLKYRKGREELEEQIREREQARMLEEELREQEAQQLLQAMADHKAEEEARERQKAERTRQMLKDVAISNEISMKLKADDRQREIEEDMKLAEFIKKKAEDEEALERAKLEEKAEKDRIFREMLAQQERANETAGLRDEIAARRATEEKERIQRRKEQAEAEARRLAAIELNEARARQIEIQQRQRAMETVLDRQDFERTLAAQKEIIESAQHEEETLLTRRIENRNDVLAQIREKEAAALRARKEFFAEGVKIDEEAKARRARLEKVKQRKLDEVLDSGVDQKYLTSVKRQVGKAAV